jgi:uncharacterized integral membrane protein
MIFALLMGVILGAGITIFSLQNSAFVTLTLLSDQATVPLAFVVLVSVGVGIAMTLFALLPRFIQDALDAHAERRQRELASYAETETAERNAIN